MEKTTNPGSGHRCTAQLESTENSIAQKQKTGLSSNKKQCTVMPAKARDNIFLETLLVLLLFLAANLIYSKLQDISRANGGKWADAVYYSDMAEQLRNNESVSGHAPFVYRIGTPLLVSLLPTDSDITGFFIVNLLANLVLTFLLLKLFRLYISSWKIRVFLISLFLSQWHASVRAIHFMPIYVDPLFMVCFVYSLILIHQLYHDKQPFVTTQLTLCTCLGLIIRESMIIIPLSLLALNTLLYFSSRTPPPTKTERNRLLFSVFLTGIAFATWFLLHSVIDKTNTYQFLHVAIQWFYSKSFCSFILSWFFAFGPILALLLCKKSVCVSFLLENPLLLVLLTGITLMAWIGGAHTVRILYWAMPVVYLVIGKVFEQCHWNRRFVIAIVILVFLQAISQRVLWPIPEVGVSYNHALPFFTPPGSEFPARDLLTHGGHYTVLTISLIQYLLSTALLVFLFRRSQHDPVNQKNDSALAVNRDSHDLQQTNQQVKPAKFCYVILQVDLLTTPLFFIG